MSRRRGRDPRLSAVVAACVGAGHTARPSARASLRVRRSAVGSAARLVSRGCVSSNAQTYQRHVGARCLTPHFARCTVLPVMNLLDLPQFTVDAIRPATGSTDAVLTGRFSHLRGVRNDHGALYRAGGRPINGVLSRVPASTTEAVDFDTPDAALADELAPGVTYPWVDGYWQ